MANRGSSTEQYTKRSNRILLLLGLGLIILAMVAYCGMSGGRGRREVEQGLDVTLENDPVVKPTGGEFDEFGIGMGEFVPQPNAVVMDGVVLGSQAESIITLTAQKSGAIFVGMELADTQQDGFTLGGTCAPNLVVAKDSSCTILAKWNPTTLRQIQNTLTVRWKEDNPGVFDYKTITIPMKAQSTDSKNCVVCESSCKDKEPENKRMATSVDGTKSGEVKENIVKIGDDTYKVEGEIAINTKTGEILVMQPERIPLDLKNQLMGTVSKSGEVLDAEGKKIGRLLGDGTIVSPSLMVLGQAVPVVSVIDAKGKVIGKVEKDGTVMDASKTVIGRPLVDGTVVDLSGVKIGYLRPYGLAINFTGDVIGGILPDATIVNSDKQIIGSIKPNGMAVNPNGDLIGGVVPEGIAVGAGCQALGSVLMNGQVQDAFSQNIGRVLLDGSVINEKSTDIGTVIRMGLVINEKGDVIGFVNSAGKAVDAKGAVIGCVNPDGTVAAGTKVIGAIMPKGQVIGRGCQSVGSVYPNGVAMNAAVEVVGQVWPDSYVRDVNHKIVGVVVPRGSAIADGCRLLGLMTPDGDVIDNNGLSVGCLTLEKQIIDKEKKVIGFVAPQGLVLNNEGKVIGRTRPDGKVIDNTGKVIGCVNSDGTVVGTDGETYIGYVEGSQPKNTGKGVVLSDNGEATDLTVVGTDVYNSRGEKVGRLDKRNLVVDDNERIIAYIPPDGVVVSHNGLVLGRYDRKIGSVLTAEGNRFGYVLADNSVLNSEKDKVIGALIPDKTIFMDMNGHYLATMTVEGLLQSADGETLGAIQSNGTVVNRSGQVIGMRMPQGTVYSALGKEVGSVNDKGEVLSPARSVIGHIQGNGLAISTDGKVLGGILPGISLPIGAEGLIGSLTDRGTVHDTRGRQIGLASPFGTVFGVRDNLAGRLLQIGPYIDSKGKLVGWTNFNGGLNDKTGIEIGKITVAGVAIDIDNRVIGTLAGKGTIVNNKGDYVGAVAADGQVYTADGKSAGMITGDRFFGNDKEGVLGQLVPSGVAVNAEGGLIGWTAFDGSIIDGTNQVGQVSLNGRVMSANGEMLGSYVPFGTLALSEKSNVLGLVSESGVVVSTKGEPAGRLTNDTYVSQSGKIVGRLMARSMAVNDNQTGKLVGMAGSDGVVMVAGENKPFGNVMMNGFVADLTKNIMGGLAPVGLPIGTKLNEIGVALASGQIVQEGQVKASALGAGSRAAYDKGGKILGGIVMPELFIDRNGAFIGVSAGAATIVNQEGKKLASYMPFGSALTADTIWAGGSMPMGLAINDDGYDIGVVGADGTILGKEGMMMGRILSDGTAVGLTDKNTYSTMPYAGHIVKQGLPYGYKNMVLGRTTVGGDIIDANDKKAYRELDDGTILGQEIPLEGVVLSFNPAIGHQGELLGALNGEGNVVSYAGEVMGHIATNGAVKGTHKYRILGLLVPEQMVTNNCKIVGQTSYDGQVVSGQGAVVGRISQGGWAVDSSNNRIGRAAKIGLVASPSGDYLGRTLPDSTVVDTNGVNMGCARNDGEVVNGNNETIGHVIDRGPVLSPTGEMIGRTNGKGLVVNKNNQVIGKALGDGQGTVVDNEGKKIGRAVDKNEELLMNPTTNRVETTLDTEGVARAPDGTKIFKITPDNRILDPETDEQIGKLNDDDTLETMAGDKISDIRVLKDEEGKLVGLILDDGVIVKPTTGEPIGEMRDGVPTDNNGKEMDGLKVYGGGLDSISPGLSLGQGGMGNGERRIFLGDKTFTVTKGGQLVDKDGTIIGYMGPDDNRPHALDGSLLTPNGEKSAEQKTPPPVKPFTATEDQRAQIDGLLGARRAAMKSRIRSFDRMLPDVRTLARARKKEDADWGEPKTVSTYPVDMSRMILKDKAIPAVLAHSIDSRFASVPVTAIVERHIYAEQGRRIIIPAGSRLIGTGGSGGGSKHVNKMTFTWNRLIRPDGSAFKFSANSGDAQGRGGVPAYLDERLIEKYGKPVLQSTLTSAIAFITATNDDITTKDNGDQVLSSKTQAANDARSNFIDSMSEIFQQLLDDAVDIEEVVFVPAGTRMTVFSNTDLWLRSETEDEQDYVAAYGRDTKNLRGSSKGNWIDGRVPEVAERAASQGIAVERGSNSLYYDPETNGEQGEEVVFNGEEESGDEVIDEKGSSSADEEEEAKEETPKKKPAKREKTRQITQPIFPRSQASAPKF